MSELDTLFGIRVVTDPNVPPGHVYFLNSDYLFVSTPAQGGDSMLKNFLTRLTSRKFLLALGGFITLVANKQYTEAAAVIGTWLAAEGYIDSKAVSPDTRK